MKTNPNFEKKKQKENSEEDNTQNNTGSNQPNQPTKEKNDQSKADALIKFASENCDFFLDGLHRPFTAVTLNNHKRTMKINSLEFKSYLRILHSKTFKHVALKSTIETALEQLSAICIENEIIKKVDNRLSGIDNDIYLDVGDSTYKAIKISIDGWAIVNDPPVNFIRTHSTSALPIPVEGGSILELRKFLPVMQDEDFIMLISWLVSAFAPNGPYAILTLTGAQGSGKSTLVRVIRSLIDPSKSCNRVIPNNQRDIAIYSINTWVMDFDNVRSYAGTISDILCAIATKGTFATRILYSDDTEIVFPIMRPIILSGIDNLNPESDLAQRSVVINLTAMSNQKRMPEELFWEEFNSLKPSLLGCLCDAVAAALRNKNSIDHQKYPRMADFARFSIAACAGLPWQVEDFISAYCGNIQEVCNAQLEGDPVAAVIKYMVRECGELIISATEVFDFMQSQPWISDKIKKSESWPQSVKSLKNKLTRISTYLQSHGIEMNLSFRDRDSIRKYKFVNHNLSENNIRQTERKPVRLAETGCLEDDLIDRHPEPFENFEEFVKYHEN